MQLVFGWRRVDDGSDGVKEEAEEEVVLPLLEQWPRGGKDRLLKPQRKKTKR